MYNLFDTLSIIILWVGVYLLFVIIEYICDEKTPSKESAFNAKVEEEIKSSDYQLRQRTLRKYASKNNKIVLEKKNYTYGENQSNITMVYNERLKSFHSLKNIKKNIPELFSYNNILLENFYNENYTYTILLFYPDKKIKMKILKSNSSKEGKIEIFYKNGELMYQAFIVDKKNIILNEYGSKGKFLNRVGYLYREVTFYKNFVNPSYSIPVDFLLLHLALETEDLEAKINQKNGFIVINSKII